MAHQSRVQLSKEVQRFRDDGRSSWLYNHRATATATTHALPSHPMPTIQHPQHRHADSGVVRSRVGLRSHGEKTFDAIQAMNAAL